jgi:hypothetical protein
MGELSKPIMTPVGVVYRSFHDSVAHALKSGEWAAKLFGGAATAFHVIGPSSKGYEAAIMASVPADVQDVKPRKTPSDGAWESTPEIAYVLYDSIETPIALYFHQHELVLKPISKPPMKAYYALAVDK